jgi:hypothetical protein
MKLLRSQNLKVVRQNPKGKDNDWGSSARKAAT